MAEQTLDLVPVQCPGCDFGFGQRGMDRCSKCNGIGSVFRVGQHIFQNTEEGYFAAIAELKRLDRNKIP